MTDVLSKTQSASFNGVPFFVRNSAIRFGQKNAVHNYNESDRTEAEHFGLAQDEFQLELIIYGVKGDEYLSRRNALKRELSRKGTGVLVHPFEGEIRCKVVGRPELTETMTELGQARFSVTFQKVSEKVYPMPDKDVTANISAEVDALMASINNDVANNFKTSSGFVDSYNTAKGKMNGVTDLFLKCQKNVAVATKYIDGINSGVLKFRNNINRFLTLPSKLAGSITGLFNTLKFVTEKPLDNIVLFRQMFNFGQKDDTYPPLTVENIEISKNNLVINNAIKAGSYAMACSVLPAVEFDTDDELAYWRGILNQQAEDIYEGLSFDVRNSLDVLKSTVNQYLDTLEVDRIIEFEVQSSPLTVVCYNLYGNLEKYDKIKRLNRLDDTIIVDGIIKVVEP